MAAVAPAKDSAQEHEKSTDYWRRRIRRFPPRRLISPNERQIAQLKVRDWEVRDAAGEALQPIPTNETKCPALPSVYAISKYHQERLCLSVCPAYGIEAVGLRSIRTGKNSAG